MARRIDKENIGRIRGDSWRNMGQGFAAVPIGDALAQSLEQAAAARRLRLPAFHASALRQSRRLRESGDCRAIIAIKGL